jgi:hypothetical protein
MAVNGNDNPSFRNEKNGWTRHFAFDWVGGGYNDIWASNEYEAVILANAFYNTNTRPGRRDLIVNEASVREITGNEAAYHKSLPLWD